MSNKNEIKKALYKEKPIAIRAFIVPDKTTGEIFHHYRTKLKDGTQVKFKVPTHDMGNFVFDYKMASQLLIRWMQ